MHHLPTVTYCHYLAHEWQRWNPIAITVCLLSFIVSSLSSSFFSLFLSLYFFQAFLAQKQHFSHIQLPAPTTREFIFILVAVYCLFVLFSLLPNWQQMAVPSWAYFWWRFLPVKRSPSASSERITGSFCLLKVCMHEVCIIGL